MEIMVNESMRLLRDFYFDKRVFITGHTGFKGAWLCEILLSFGAQVGGYALAPTSNTPLFNLLNLAQRTRSYLGDIRGFDVFRKSMLDFQPEIVIHLAAQPLVLASYQNPVYTYEVNVMGTVHVLEALRYCPTVRSFLNVTTDKVYENREWVWGYREDERLCGQDPYSNSKSCSELTTFSYKNSFFNKEDAPAISTARGGNVIGGGDFSKNRIVPDCVRAALDGEKILLRNPQSIRPYQHVLDCLYGYLLLAMKQYGDKALYEGNYNFGPSEDDCVTTEFLAERFCRIWGNGLSFCSIVSPKSVPHESNFLKLDCSKAREQLGWRPRWRILRALEEVAEWTRIYDAGKSIAVHMKEQINLFFR